MRNMNPEKAERLRRELQAALEPLLAAIESVSERIREYNEHIEWKPHSQSSALRDVDASLNGKLYRTRPRTMLLWAALGPVPATQGCRNR